MATYNVLLNNARPNRPPDLPIAEKRGLDDEIWALVEACWRKDPNERLYMRDVKERLLDIASAKMGEGEDDTLSEDSSVEFEAFPL